jgi:predicted ester cyclase
MDTTAVDGEFGRLEANKAVVRRFVEEVQNNKDEAAYDELDDPDFVNLSAPPGVPSDRDGGKAYLWSLFNAFPDSRWTIDDMVAEGDLVVTKKTMRGTHTGEFGGIPATGRPVTLQYVDILRLREGRIVEHWLSMDSLSFMQQLGVIPAPA